MATDPRSLVRGMGRFLDDALPAGTLHAQFVRSDLAHAHVRDISVGSLSSGTVVHTSHTLDVPRIPSRLRGRGPEATGMHRHPLAIDRVRYVGEPIALVLAESLPGSMDGMDAVFPDLDPLPAVIDPREAASDSVLLFPESGSNVVNRTTRGRANEPADGGEIRLRMRFHHSRLAGTPIEPLGIAAIPTVDGMEIWCGHQAPHRLLAHLQEVFEEHPGLDFRVRVPDVGGAFGTKGPLYAEYVAIVAAALAHDRPIVWRQRRREQFTGGTHGRGAWHEVEMTGSPDGRIESLRISVIGDLGAYPQSGFMVPETIGTIGGGPYDVPDLGVTVTSVVTNTAPTGPYRGAGRPEAALALERTVDAYARRIGRAPEDVRRINLIDRAAMPYRSPTGAVYDDGDYRLALETALREIDIDSLRDERRDRRSAGLNPIGIGISCFVEPAGGSVTSGEYGSVAIERDGRITVMTGSTAAGQGHAALWTRLVAEALHVAEDDVVFVSGDTGRVPAGEGTFGSRSVQVGAVGIHRMATELALRIRRLAAEVLEAAEDDIRLADGGAQVVGSPETRLTFADLHARAQRTGQPLVEEEFYAPGAQTFPSGTHIACVEVDRETGEVHVRRIVAVDDCGEVLDRAGVSGQLHGGLVQGLGAALTERIRYRPDGEPLTTSLVDYPLPRAADVPPIRLIHSSTRAPNTLGARGVGESGIVGLPAAILNAVHDAINLDGAELDLPLEPSKVLAAMRDIG